MSIRDYFVQNGFSGHIDTDRLCRAHFDGKALLLVVVYSFSSPYVFQDFVFFFFLCNVFISKANSI